MLKPYQTHTVLPFLLYFQVALGKIKETEDLGEPVMHSDSKHNSVAGLGQKIPDDTFDVVLPYG